MYSPEIGGVEIVAEKIAELASEIGYDSRVLTYNNNNIFNTEIRKGVEVIRLPSHISKGSIRWSFNFSKNLKIKAENSDILIFHFPSFQPEIDLFIRDKYKSTKKICFYHADIVGRGILGFAYNKIIVKNFLKKMDKIIVTSPNMKNSSPVLESFKDKVEIVPLFVETKHFYYRENNQRENLIRKFDTDINKIILYIGRLGRYKGLEYLVKSMIQLQDDVGLVMIGSGVKKKELENIAIENNLNDRILFLDHVDYKILPEFYSSADVFVLPSTDRGEAFGLVAIEAMACGIPIITTELGTGTSYHNINNKTGRIIDPSDSSEIAKSINYIFKNDFSKEAIIERAQQFDLNNFKKNIINKIL